MNEAFRYVLIAGGSALIGLYFGDWKMALGVCMLALGMMQMKGD